MAMCYPDSTDWSCVGTPEEIAALDPVKKARAEALAWGSIARLSGFRVSTCPVVLRPCRVRCAPEGYMTAPVNAWGDSFTPYIENGRWFNACGCRRDQCGCGVIRELILPEQEVSGPVVVTINGAVLDPSAYRVDNGNRLVRQDGQDWPMCQDMNLPLFAPPVVEPASIVWPSGERIDLTRVGDTITAHVYPNGVTEFNSSPRPIPAGFIPRQEGQFTLHARDNYAAIINQVDGAATIVLGGIDVPPYLEGEVSWLAAPLEPVAQDGTFSVSYYVGVGPDDLLNYAAGLLAGEWYKACDGRDCQLPNTVTQVVRQGVTFTIPSFDSGTSGMREVDNIIAIYNPHHLKTPSRVLSVDSIRGRKRTA